MRVRSVWRGLGRAVSNRNTSTIFSSFRSQEIGRTETTLLCKRLSPNLAGGCIKYECVTLDNLNLKSGRRRSTVPPIRPPSKGETNDNEQEQKIADRKPFHYSTRFTKRMRTWVLTLFQCKRDGPLSAKAHAVRQLPVRPSTFRRDRWSRPRVIQAQPR